jgi:hypothetical protein
MRLNAKIGTHYASPKETQKKLTSTKAISTSKVLLVPYSSWHVPRYHEWMKDEVGTSPQNPFTSDGC